MAGTIHEEATAAFAQTISDLRLSGAPLGEALIAALHEAAQVAGTKLITLSVEDGDLSKVKVRRF